MPERRRDVERQARFDIVDREGGRRRALALPRVDRVPPLRCSQFAAPIWLMRHRDRRLYGNDTGRAVVVKIREARGQTSVHGRD